MSLTNAGRNLIAQLIAGSGTALNSANAYVGVGDSSTAFDPTQTDLQSASNKVRVLVDTNYPSVSGNQIMYQGTFGPTVANWAWNEWGLFNASSGGTMLDRVVEYDGTKISGQTWVLQVQVTVNIGV